MNMRLTEEEKKQIMSKYSGDTSDQLLIHLKRHFPTTEIKHDWMNEPIKFIQVGDKTVLLSNNKKNLVSKISGILMNDWLSLDEKTIRRTVKKYLDGVTL